MNLNPEIISEIKNETGIDEKTRAFLIWAVEFERENLDIEKPQFKNKFSAKLDQLIGDGEDSNNQSN